MIKRYFVFLRVILVFGLVPFFSVADNEEKGDIVVDDISVSISAGTSFCVSDNVKVSGDGEFINSGTMWFANTTPLEMNFLSTNSGDGKFIFSGNSDCTLNGDANWGKVSMQNSEGYLFLNGTLTVDDSLELKGGIIDSGSSKLILQDNHPNALVFSNTPEDKSYILGTFMRAIALNGSYWFPVGDEDGFHPFLVQNAEAKDNIEVSYDSGISQEWAFVVPDTPFTIEDIGGWKVDSQTSFNSGLSLLNKNQELMEDGKYSILYTANSASYSSEYQWDQSAVKSTVFYMLSSQKLQGGIYALASEETLRLTNFIYDAGNSSDNNFEIPEISKYSKVELTVYNHWGQQVYEDHDYNNGFNCSNFPQGTYFYELKLHQGKSVELIRNIIEVKREK